MKDGVGDEIETYVQMSSGTVVHRLHDSFSRLPGQPTPVATAMLSPKKARKLAKKLLAAADEIDDAQGRDLGPKHEERIIHLERENRAAARAAIDQGAQIEKLRAEQHWDREQITVLLAELGAQREREAEEGDGTATPVDDEIHYLLPRSWILDHSRNLNTSKAGSVTFQIPAGTHLRDRVSTGFAR